GLRRAAREHAFDRQGGDPGERSLGQRMPQKTRLLGLPRSGTAEDRAQQARLLVDGAGQVRELAGILEVVDAAPLEVTRLHLLLACPLLQQLSELDTLIWRHACERVRGRLLVFLTGCLSRHRAVAGQDLLIGVAFPWRSLFEPLEKGLVFLTPLPTTQQRVEKAHGSFLPFTSRSVSGGAATDAACRIAQVFDLWTRAAGL